MTCLDHLMMTMNLFQANGSVFIKAKNVSVRVQTGSHIHHDTSASPSGPCRSDRTPHFLNSRSTLGTSPAMHDVSFTG